MEMSIHWVLKYWDYIEDNEIFKYRIRDIKDLWIIEGIAYITFFQTEENDIKCERVIMEIRHYSNRIALFNHYGKWLAGKAFLSQWKEKPEGDE